MVTGSPMEMQQWDTSYKLCQLRGTVGEQKMANLPGSRVEPVPPFCLWHLPAR